MDIWGRQLGATDVIKECDREWFEFLFLLSDICVCWQRIPQEIECKINAVNENRRRGKGEDRATEKEAGGQGSKPAGQKKVSNTRIIPVGIRDKEGHIERS